MPAQAREIAAALVCPHALVLVSGAGHGDVLDHEESWREVVGWLGAAAASPPRTFSGG